MALVRARELFDEAPWLWGCAGAGAVFVTGLVTLKAVSASLRHKAIKKRRKNYREQKLQEKRAYAQRFNASKEEVDRICSLSLQTLQDKLQNDELSASQVLQAYQAKTADVDKKINCVTDYITEAEEEARKLDAAKTKGPLHGLPFSIKEFHMYKGYASTSGIQTLIPHLAEKSYPIIDVLKRQGAVPFVRTNVPYACLGFTCWNPLYGKTGNPLDPDRQPGGSDSGEAAMVSAGATAISIGSDIGGSTRQPAAWCGIVGLKCSTARLSNPISVEGLPLEGFKPTLDTAYGPLSRDVDGAAFILRHLLVEDMFGPDSYTAPIPFREERYNDRKPLTIGFYSYDNITHVVPSCIRAVDLVKVKLQEQGHTMVPFNIPAQDGCGNRWLDLFSKIFQADGGKLLDLFLAGDEPGEFLQMSRMPFPRMPRWFNILVSKIWQIFDKRNGLAKEYGCGAGSVFAWWEIVSAVVKWRRQVLEKMKRENIDVLLSPAFYCPAMPQKNFFSLAGHASYLTVYNLLDWPAGVLPVTSVTSQDIQEMNQFPQDTVESRMISDGMRGSEGLPVAVQIAAPPYGEELCLRVMKEIEDVIHYRRST